MHQMVDTIRSRAPSCPKVLCLAVHQNSPEAVTRFNIEKQKSGGQRFILGGCSIRRIHEDRRDFCRKEQWMGGRNGHTRG